VAKGVEGGALFAGGSFGSSGMLRVGLVDFGAS